MGKVEKGERRRAEAGGLWRRREIGVGNGKESHWDQILIKKRRLGLMGVLKRIVL